jgi:hypothetical protein
MNKLQLKNCWLKSTGNVNQRCTLLVRIPESEQQKLLQWLPFEYAGNFDIETGMVIVTTQGITRDQGDALILKLDGTPSTYSTRDSKGGKHSLGASFNQPYTVTLCLPDDYCVGLYSIQFEQDPPLNSHGQVHVEPTRKPRATPKVELEELEV